MEDLVSDEDQPPFAAATMDGFAVISGDSDPVRRIVGDQFAGTMEALHVEPGTAAYITTGAPLPPGADAVVQIERTEQTAGGVRIGETPRAGQNIRPVGSDLKHGDRVLAAGTVLTPAAVGLIASLGRTGCARHAAAARQRAGDGR